MSIEWIQQLLNRASDNLPDQFFWGLAFYDDVLSLVASNSASNFSY